MGNEAVLVCGTGVVVKGGGASDGKNSSLIKAYKNILEYLNDILSELLVCTYLNKQIM